MILCRALSYEENTLDKSLLTNEDETILRTKMLQDVLGHLGEGSEINPDIKLDYGCNTYIGDWCYINFNSVFLDCAEIHLGNNVFVGPSVSFLTPLHPMLAGQRNVRFTKDGRPYTLESAKPIMIEDSVWICANVAVLPGVTIGHDTVIGAGSVVTRDIPPHSFAAGNPCRVIREITEADSMQGKVEAYL